MKKHVTRFLAVLLSLSMALSMTVLTSAEEYTKDIDPVEQPTVSKDAKLLFTFMTDKDYTQIITDADYDNLFKGDTTAMQGVEDVLNAGQFYINGYKVPQTEEECGDAFVIMGYNKLYKDGDAWKAENNKRTGTTFDDARLGMVEALSRTTGMPVYFYDTDGDGYTDMIQASFYAVCVVENMTENADGTYSIDRGDFQLTKSNLDVNDVKFPKANVDENIQIGDMAMFWQDAETGWHLQREVSVKGYLTDARDHSYYVFNGETIKDGMNNPKAYIYFGNRPGQYSNAHLAFGLGDVEITYWVTDRGSVISGFSSGDNARTSLERAIAYCENVRKLVTVSEDGTDVSTGQQWVTREAWDTYNEAIKAAQATLDDELASNSVVDGAIYTLFQKTWGDSAKYDYIVNNQTDKFGGFLGSVKYGTSTDTTLLYTFLTDANYTDIITDATYDKYFEKTAMESVEDIINAGQCYINGYKVPQTEEECGDAFVIMGYNKLYKENGVWKAENNKRTGTTFEDARMGMVEALSRTTGMPVYLYDTNGDGKADKIEMTFYAVCVVEGMTNNGDGTVSIDRGDFQLTKSNLDVNDVKFPEANVDKDIEIGDMAMFWQDAETGWHLEREISETGYLTDSRDHSYYVFNGIKIKDGMNNPKAYIYFGNRPGQYSNAHMAFGLTDVPITYWRTDSGAVISGFSSGEYAAYSLKRAIAICEEYLASVVISKDGKEVKSDLKWVTQEAYDTYKAAIDDAKEIYADKNSSNSVLDGAIYTLFQATWGTNAKYDYIVNNQTDKFGGFLGAVQSGTMDLVKNLVVVAGSNFFKALPLTDASYDQYYKTTAAEGLKEIVASGKAYINNVPLPSCMAELTEDYIVNGQVWIDKDSCKTNAEVVAAGIAALGNVSIGNPFTLYDQDGDGKADVICAMYYEGLIVNKITKNGDNDYTVECAEITTVEGSGEADPYGYHIFAPGNTNKVVELQETDGKAITEGSCVVFWQEEDGWHMKRAVEATGVLVDAQDHEYYNIGGTLYTDAMRFSRGNLSVSNRNGEYINAAKYFGFNNNTEGLTVSLWLAPTGEGAGQGAPIGITSNDNARTFLEKAVEFCKNKLAGVKVSEDGTDVSSADSWVTQETYDQLESMIKRAEALLEEKNVTNNELDYQMYLLFLVCAGSDSDIGAKFEGFSFVGFDNCISKGKLLYTYVDDADGMYADDTVASLLGTDAKAKVEELLNAGNVYVNGKALPTSEKDTAALSDTDARGESVKGFALNGLVSFYNTADGWIQTVHKATSAATTFTAARAAFIEGVSKMTGLTMEFYDMDGDGQCDTIGATVKEVLRVDSFCYNTDGTYSIDRGNFTLGNRAGSLEINDIASFAEANWDESIEAGDMIYYWQDAEGWHAQKADYTTGLLTDGKDHGYYIFDGVRYTDCNMTKYYLITGNRPGQFLTAHLYLGLEDEEVIMWTVGETYPFGFTSADPAGSLEKAISNVKERLLTAVLAENGMSVPVGTYYVTSIENGKAVVDALDAAQAVLDSKKASAADLDLAIYNLYNNIKGKLLEGEVIYTFVDDADGMYADENVTALLGSDAKAKVEELLNAGKVYVNGKALPTSENDTAALSDTDARGDSAKGFAINGLVSFYNTADGWIQTVHKATSQATTFTAARAAFIEGVSKMTGLTMEFCDTDGDGQCDAISATVKEVLRVDSFTQAEDGTVKIDRGNFTLGSRAGSFDINDIASFSKANWDSSIEAGDMIYYWQDAEGWHAQKADCTTGLLTDGKDHGYYIFDGVRYTDCNMTKYYLITGNRPGQFLTAHLYLGLEDEAVNMWTVGETYPFGFTSADPKASLEKAISNVEEKLASTTVAKNGMSVPVGSYYVTSEENGKAVVDAVVAAQKVLDDEESSAADLDLAIYNLYNSIKGKILEGEVIYTYVDDADGMYADENVTSLFGGGDVKAQVEELLNAGKVYVNGKALPTSENDTAALSNTDARGDSAKGFSLNGLVSFYNTADGWIQTVHKATSQATTFTAARAAFIEGVSKMTGLTMEFCDTDGDGKCDAISATVKEVLRVDSFTQAADGTIRIDRGNFTLGSRAGSLEINTIASFSKANWDESIEAGDMIYYWQDTDGWHAQKADYTTGLLTDGKDHGYYIFDGVRYTDCNMTKYYLITGNRPGQFLTAHLYLGLEDEEVNMWTVGETYPFGFTSADPAGSLEKAISNVEDRLENAVVAADGTSVAVGKYYVTSAEDGEAVEEAVVAAQKVLDNEKSSAADLDLAIYNLYNTIKGKLLEGNSMFTDIFDCSTGVQTAINWAANNGIVNGKTVDTFDPYAYCTRAQMVVMLYRLAGKPDVTAEEIAAVKEKFSDVNGLSWGVIKAVAWAVSEGIINGYKDGTFRPEDSVSRASTVVMLWRMAGKPEVRAAATFTDTANCSAGVMKAINWAASVEITKGSANGDGTYSFAPEDACQRQHIVTFIYRYVKNVD